VERKEEAERKGQKRPTIVSKETKRPTIVSKETYGAISRIIAQTISRIIAQICRFSRLEPDADDEILV
jgi:hypothetical protein